MKSYSYAIMEWPQFQPHCKHVGESPIDAKRYTPPCGLAGANAGWSVECSIDNCPIWENFQITPLSPLYEHVKGLSADLVDRGAVK